MQGNVWKFGDHIDTDVIIPARYLNDPSPQNLKAHCLEDLDPAFRSHVQPGDILVCGANFGCGSSREHAPLALKYSGIAAVIAISFARIFYRNCINIGLPILECPAAYTGIQTGDVVSIDLVRGEILNLTNSKAFQAEPFPDFLQAMMLAGGRLPYLRKQMEGAKQ